jgi:acetyl esterase/lipase
MINDDAYANSAHIPDGEGYYARWEEKAAAFREGHALKELGVSYGPAEAQTYDIFHPNRSSKGTVVFVHGGYWMACTPQDYSHLAAGAVAAGYAFAMPRYTLAPEARIAQITQEVATAMAAIARRTVGPLILTGHSAGGHLVARMACTDTAAEWSERVARIVAISPLSDLAPLRDTSVNETLQIDEAEALSESPAHLSPQDIAVTAWVGGAERPAFLDQARWLAESWSCEQVIEPDRHHFDVIEGLEDPRSALMQRLLS